MTQVIYKTKRRICEEIQSLLDISFWLVLDLILMFRLDLELGSDLLLWSDCGYFRVRISVRVKVRFTTSINVRARNSFRFIYSINIRVRDRDRVMIRPWLVSRYGQF